MAIERTYTIEKMLENAKNVVVGIKADNINKTPTIDASFIDGYRWGGTKLIDRTLNCRWSGENQKFNGILKTIDDIPAACKKMVTNDTVASQFESWLKTLGLTQKALQGSVVSVRTAQAIVDAITAFVIARYELWMNPGGTKTMVLYNSGGVSYVFPEYNYKVLDYSDKVLKTQTKVNGDDLDKLMRSVVNSALGSLKVKRQQFEQSITGINSSCSSSSCSSSSCSSSSCSSSCSSSSSSVFIAYMKLF